MGVIETEEGAKRLARVIVSDIEIYNRDKFQAGADLTAAIEEGRALFRSRVAPALFPLFTTVLEDRRGATGKRASAPAPAHVETIPAERSGGIKSAPAPQRNVGPASGPISTTAPASAVTPAPAVASAHPPVARPAPRAATAARVAPAAPAASAATPAPAPATDAPAAAPPIETAAPAPAAPAQPAARPAATNRGGSIDNEEAAARLARVIISDIQLYNAKKIASGADLSHEIEEGRSLFKSRVGAELIPIFETTLASKGLGERRRSAPASAPAPQSAAAHAHAVVAAAPAAAPASKPRSPQVAAETPAPIVNSHSHSQAQAQGAATPRPTVPPGTGRSPFPAVKAPAASQPRPGAAAVRRPTPAAAPITDSGSGRHLVRHPTPASHFGHHQDEAAAHAAPGGHAGRDPAAYDQLAAQRAAQRTPEPAYMVAESPSDELTPAMRAEPTPEPAITPAPSARASMSRPSHTPPPLPMPGRSAPPPMRSATPQPPPTRRPRPPSLPEVPITVDAMPFSDEATLPEESMPPQEVLDALPVPAPLPPLPRIPTPATLAVQPRLPTPPSLPLQAAVPSAIDAETSLNNEIASLRRTISKTRVVLTVATLGGAAAVLYHYFMR